MEWISVKDRLPKENTQVLTILKHPGAPENLYQHVAEYYGKDDDVNGVPVFATPFEILHFVTHWQPLPEPPKPMEDKEK